MHLAQRGWHSTTEYACQPDSTPARQHAPGPRRWHRPTGRVQGKHIANVQQSPALTMGSPCLHSDGYGCPSLLDHGTLAWPTALPVFPLIHQVPLHF